MLETIVFWYAPHHCLGCESEGFLLCADCREGLTPVADRCYRCRALSPAGKTCQSCRRQSKLAAVRAVTTYEGVAKDLVGRLKFSGAKAAARTIAETMAELDIPTDVVLVHVPTATGRIRLRGYDHAALVAKQLAHFTETDYLPCLRRIGQHRQVGASRAQRLAQMRESFLITDVTNVVGRHVVLIDDVMTTGASLESAAAVLYAAGATRVEAIIFARA